ncbi:integrase core domain-containing protein [Paenactinomyces guangxiensis]|uniref:Transposase n=1 Tax=Paenactinomyces guangxiensis TaxID=1490290 RepID=A0A7W1WNZ4_9BACL|nr:integrase core domain-containing protein [Paenactinomyces guangxiensis]MBA4493259.1 transposase [Paenactinomyces guangxiensis]MBH8589890.1 transposase [Paenactinomyces guangxiensis]
MLRTYNGPQFICHEFEILHKRIPPTPNKNAHIESFHSSLEKECLIKHEFQSYPEIYQAVTDYIDFYNKRRIHGSLYDLSPYEFMQAIIDQEVQSFVVKV